MRLRKSPPVPPVPEAAETLDAERRVDAFNQAVLRYIEASPIPPPARPSLELQAEIDAQEAELATAQAVVARLTDSNFLSHRASALSDARRDEGRAEARVRRLAEALASDDEAVELERQAVDAAAVLPGLAQRVNETRARLEGLQGRLEELRARAVELMRQADDQTAAGNDDGALDARSEAQETQRKAEALADQGAAVRPALTAAEAAVADQEALVAQFEAQAAAARRLASDRRWLAAGGSTPLLEALQRQPMQLLMDPDVAVRALLR